MGKVRGTERGKTERSYKRFETGSFKDCASIIAKFFILVVSTST
jgi:hypothetical protein